MPLWNVIGIKLYLLVKISCKDGSNGSNGSYHKDQPTDHNPLKFNTEASLFITSKYLETKETKDLQTVIQLSSSNTHGDDGEFFTLLQNRIVALNKFLYWVSWCFMIYSGAKVL